MRRLAAALFGSLVLALSIVPDAQAATVKNGPCTDDQSVTVVVDFQKLGGKTITKCVSGLGKRATAYQAYVAAGISLEGTGRFGSSVVCRVNGIPRADQDLHFDGEVHRETCVDMPPTGAYWAIFHAKNGGSWTYSNSGIQDLMARPNTYVGLSFSLDNINKTNPPPRVKPSHSTAPEPKPTPTAPPKPSDPPKSSAPEPDPTKSTKPAPTSKPKKPAPTSNPPKQAPSSRPAKSAAPRTSAPTTSAPASTAPSSSASTAPEATTSPSPVSDTDADSPSPEPDATESLPIEPADDNEDRAADKVDDGGVVTEADVVADEPNSGVPVGTMVGVGAVAAAAVAGTFVWWRRRT